MADLHRFAEFVRNVNRAFTQPGIDEIHDLRVSIRRLRQMQKLYQLPLNRQAQRDLKQLMKLAGAIRDIDISSRYLDDAGLRDLMQTAQSKRLQAEREFLKFLNRPALQLRQDQQSFDELSLPAAKKRLRRLANRFYKAGRKASQKQATVDELHEARIAAKKLRYTLELLPDSSAASTKPFEKIQKMLGEINDLRTVNTFIEVSSSPSKLAKSFRKKQQSAIRDFCRYWKSEIWPDRKSALERMLAGLKQT